MKNKLQPNFYQRDNVITIAKELMGKVLYSNFEGQVTAGIICETEAYNGVEDRACHAYGDRRTPRTEVMYQLGGITYVYLCYGIHNMLNVVTGPKNVPQAVLIRAIIPLEGIDMMAVRRNNKQSMSSGPGTVAQALGITTAHNGISLEENSIWIEDHGVVFDSITDGPRIGVDYAGPDAFLPYRNFLP